MIQNMTKNIIDIIKLNNDDLIKLIFTKKSICSKNNNFITNIVIFNNILDIIQNIESKLKENNIKYITTNETFTRDQYYSQICDKLEKSEKIYTKDLKLIHKISDKNTDIFIFKSDIIQQHRLSFPNLQQYHHSIKIDATYIIIDNIKIICENSNVFIEIKNNKKELNIKALEIILNILFC